MLATIIVAIIVAVAAVLIQEKKLRRDFELDLGRMRTDRMAEDVAGRILGDERWGKEGDGFSAENAVRELLGSERWSKQRSFKTIKARLGGFEDDELRKILVRAGAIRFKGQGDSELWGLMSRNQDNL
ncbi:MAG: hypothetical protein ACE5DR_06670 [Thermodesulfobacteriota bacterium]